jgi:hypothetical protein
MCIEPVEGRCLICNVHIDDIVLKEAASVEEGREGYTDIEVVPVKHPLLKPCLFTGPISIL